MPRNVRNFWAEVNIDGYKTPLRGGPISKDGGINICLFVRNNGEVHKAIQIDGFAANEGRLVIQIQIEKEILQEVVYHR